MDWLDLLVVQGTLKSLLQHHSSEASITLALSLLYGPTLLSVHDSWKDHLTFVGKMMSLLFNMLSGFVMASGYSSLLKAPCLNVACQDSLPENSLHCYQDLGSEDEGDFATSWLKPSVGTLLLGEQAAARRMGGEAPSPAAHPSPRPQPSRGMVSAHPSPRPQPSRGMGFTVGGPEVPAPLPHLNLRSRYFPCGTCTSHFPQTRPYLLIL